MNIFAMHPSRIFLSLALSSALFIARSAFATEPVLPGVAAAMQEIVAKSEIAGAVTVVVTKDKMLHLESTGSADSRHECHFLLFRGSARGVRLTILRQAASDSV